MSSYSPQELRISHVARFVALNRERGMSDSAIRSSLSVQENLAANHPCANPSGVNICSAAEINAGFEQAPLYGKGSATPQKPPARRTQIPWLWIGLGVVGLVVLIRRRS